MHLGRLRKFGWHEKWQEASRKFFERNVLLMQADQDIFNIVIDLNPTLYFRVPCEWNVQLCAKTAPDCCPIVWPMKRPQELDCVTKPQRTLDEAFAFRPNMARLVHFTGKDKHAYLEQTTQDNSSLDGIEERLTQVQMKTRYGEAFRAFQALPLTCF
ncbi:hypothetical protein EG68_01822 [Paragonimus skrjabini miyazakii]|uniref:Uncharacterized protein n=1 Tax=Paragonimus skrjabini miyazakii TaxID=59628 RepID=A0A8S9Z1H2_9TREM|nr:hypothetical protein EG68_01822 [Paragonimus skrjabini miyazakii]